MKLRDQIATMFMTREHRQWVSDCITCTTHLALSQSDIRNPDLSKSRATNRWHELEAHRMAAQLHDDYEEREIEKALRGD